MNRLFFSLLVVEMLFKRWYNNSEVWPTEINRQGLCLFLFQPIVTVRKTGFFLIMATKKYPQKRVLKILLHRLEMLFKRWYNVNKVTTPTEVNRQGLLPFFIYYLTLNIFCKMALFPLTNSLNFVIILRWLHSLKIQLNLLQLF